MHATCPMQGGWVRAMLDPILGDYARNVPDARWVGAGHAGPHTRGLRTQRARCKVGDYWGGQASGVMAVWRPGGAWPNACQECAISSGDESG